MGKGGWRVVLALLALAVGVVGCGGSDSDTAGTASGMTKAQFEAKAKKLCEKGEDEREAALGVVSTRFKPNASDSEKEEALGVLLEPYEDTAERLSAISAPEGEEEQVDEMVEAMHKAVAQAKANPQTAYVSNIPFQEANQLLALYDLEDCQV